MNDANKATNAKLVGPAIVALRAWIKALEMAAGQFRSSGQYRYEISADRTSARIVDTANGGAEVEGSAKSLEEWANLGRSVRLAFVGLKDAKFKLEEEAQASGEPGYVRFTLDIIAGTASLSRGSETLVTPPAGAQPWNKLGLTALPQDIATWAKVGREVEKPLFERLKAAQEWGSEAGVHETREIMIKLGIIRAPRDSKE